MNWLGTKPRNLYLVWVNQLIVFAFLIPNSLSLQYHHDSIVDYDPKSTSLPITYLHCPAAVTIHHLYKFILTKNGLQLGNERIQMDIIYEDEILPHEFTLMDVAYCYDYKRVSAF